MEQGSDELTLVHRKDGTVSVNGGPFRPFLGLRAPTVYRILRPVTSPDGDPACWWEHRSDGWHHCCDNPPNAPKCEGPY